MRYEPREECALKLNDPFGRVSRRDRDRYTALRERLHGEGIRDAVAVQRFIRNMSVTLLRLVTVVVATALGLAIVLPETRHAAILIASLLLLWLVVGYVQTRLYLSKYLREECGDR